MGVDKRRFVRLNAKVEVSVKKVGDGAAMPGVPSVTKNMGAAGVCLITRKVLKPGDTVAMEIKLPAGKIIAVSGVVRWAVEQGTLFGLGLNDFHAGIEFTNISDKDRDEIGKFVFDSINYG